jgi:hypothetical protein
MDVLAAALDLTLPAAIWWGVTRDQPRSVSHGRAAQRACTLYDSLQLDGSREQRRLDRSGQQVSCDEAGSGLRSG